MPIPFRPPLPPDDNWDAHRREVKACRGAACYGALVVHFGTESSKELERRIDCRPPYVTAGGDPSYSNKYLRWRQGIALPNDDSVKHLLARSGGSVNLSRWRDLALWELLESEPPTVQRINQLLEQSPLLIRKILFIDAEPNRLGRYIHTMPNRAQTLGIRNHFSIDAFIALLCLARKGEVLENDPMHFLPSACAFDIFPRILYSHPQLAYRWEALFRCLERVYWLRLYGDGMYYDMKIDVVGECLEALRTNPAFAVPMTMSGRRVRDVVRYEPETEERVADHDH